MASINPLEVYDQIAPRLERLSRRVSDLPADFRGDAFSTTVGDWAKELASMLVLPQDAARAIDELAATSRWFPSLSDIMRKVGGEGWATDQIAFRVPIVLWEEVIDLATGKVVEVYPFMCPGTRSMTRLEIKRYGCPDWDIEVDRITGSNLGEQALEMAAKRSGELGYQVRAGRLSTSRKPNIRSGSVGPGSGQVSQVRARSDLDSQLSVFAVS